MRLRSRFAASAALLLCATAGAAPLAAQDSSKITVADYARAERAMSYNVTPLVFGTSVRPTWLPDERFWFRDLTPTGSETILVDPAKGTRTRCDNEPNHCGIDFPPDSGAGRGGRGGARWRARRTRRRTRAGDDVARRNQGRLHPRLESLGSRRRHRARDAAHDRRRERLRLRDRQRRLAEQRPRDSPLVARLQEDRHVPAGSAQRRRAVSGQHQGRSSRAAHVQVSTARRQRRHDDPPRDHRPEWRDAAHDPPPDARRPAPLHAV